MKSGKISTGQFQRELYNVQANYVNIASNLKKEALTSQIFGAYETQPYLLATRLIPEFERAGFEVEDKVGYMGADLRSLLKLRSKVLHPERDELPFLRRRTA